MTGKACQLKLNTSLLWKSVNHGQKKFYNIRLGWGLPGENALAHYEHWQINSVKSFITWGPDEPTYAPIWLQRYHLIYLIFGRRMHDDIEANSLICIYVLNCEK